MNVFLARAGHAGAKISRCSRVCPRTVRPDDTPEGKAAFKSTSKSLNLLFSEIEKERRQEGGEGETKGQTHFLPGRVVPGVDVP